MPDIVLGSSYAPSIEQLALSFKASKTFVDGFSNFQKQSLRNRCWILSANGPLALTIPVIKESGKKTQLKDVEISYKEDWSKDHLGALNAAYKSSAFYEHYIDELEPILKSAEKNLLRFNVEICNWMWSKIGFKPEIENSQEYLGNKAIPNFEFTLLKSYKSELDCPTYPQVFSDKFSFAKNLSGLDLLFNLGPESYSYLAELAEKINLTSYESREQ